MKCPKCQTELPENAKYCGVCGQALSAERNCPHCGQANPQDFKFCLQCGRPLGETAPPTAAAGPSPLPAAFANGRYRVKKLLGAGTARPKENTRRLECRISRRNFCVT